MRFRFVPYSLWQGSPPLPDNSYSLFQAFVAHRLAAVIRMSQTGRTLLWDRQGRRGPATDAFLALAPFGMRHHYWEFVTDADGHDLPLLVPELPIRLILEQTDGETAIECCTETLFMMHKWLGNYESNLSWRGHVERYLCTLKRTVGPVTLLLAVLKLTTQWVAKLVQCGVPVAPSNSGDSAEFDRSPLGALLWSIPELWGQPTRERVNGSRCVEILETLVRGGASVTQVYHPSVALPAEANVYRPLNPSRTDFLDVTVALEPVAGSAAAFPYTPLSLFLCSVNGKLKRYLRQATALAETMVRLGARFEFRVLGQPSMDIGQLCPATTRLMHAALPLDDLKMVFLMGLATGESPLRSFRTNVQYDQNLLRHIMAMFELMQDHEIKTLAKK